MIPSFFYLTQYVPRTFEAIINTATGSQINLFLVRSYLQHGYSIPKADPPVDYEGAISFGIPGKYLNSFKIDVSSLYPSIIRQYRIGILGKDPNSYFLKMVDFFTENRLLNKKLAKETGDKYYEDLQQSSKVFINSAYGFLGATGLNYNCPESAAKITEHGRNIIIKSIEWAEGISYEDWQKNNNMYPMQEDEDAFREGYVQSLST